MSNLEGRLLVDGVDVWSAYGGFIVDGANESIVGWASLKEMESNDWHEYDGLEVDLTNPVLDTRSFEVKMAFSGLTKRPNKFLNTLSNGSYHEWYFADLGVTKKLRLVSMPNINDWTYLGLLSLTLAEDAPLEDYERPSSLTSYISESTDWSLDDLYFSDYGVRVLEGSLDEFKRLPDVKQNLLWNINEAWGAYYDDPADDEEADDTLVRYQSKDMTLNCLLRAKDISQFWTNWNALLYDLIQSGSRTLSSQTLGKSLTCHYVSCSVSEFHIDPAGVVWCKFGLTLRVLSQRPFDETFVLGTKKHIAVLMSSGKAILLS